MDAVVETKIGEVEECARLIVYELYMENADDLGAIYDEAIKTAVLAELASKGYEAKNISTITAEVKGLSIKDSTGNIKIDEVALVQGANKIINVSLDTKGHTYSSSYVKIKGNYYELTIKGKCIHRKICKNKWRGKFI